MKVGVMRRCLIFVVTFYAALLTSSLWADDQVTTYIIKVQKERESTRFTLTEWLKIKERMKMMDVWLAMFSDPAKQKLSPEFMASYAGLGGTLTQTYNGAKTIGSTDGSAATAQFWFTNLITATAKVKTLNIDLGLEGGTTSQNSTGTGGLPTGKLAELGYGAMTFRLFGSSIQDSGLFLRAGKYQKTLNTPYAAQKLQGLMGGGSITIYLFNFLGIDGNYMAFGDNQSLSSADHQGSYYDYSVFLEGGVLRVGGGHQGESWKFKYKTVTDVQIDQTAGFVYLKLMF